MRYNICCSCKNGKHNFCIKCEEIVNSSCDCIQKVQYYTTSLNGVVIYICLECMNELRADQETKK